MRCLNSARFSLVRRDEPGEDCEVGRLWVGVLLPLPVEGLFERENPVPLVIVKDAQMLAFQVIFTILN